MRFLVTTGLISALACLAQQQAIVVPAGTEVVLAVTTPLSRSAQIGDGVYAETAFPVAVNGVIAIPPGTYVQGQIEIMTDTGLITHHAELRIQFTQMVFAGGSAIGMSDDAFATLNVQVGPGSAILLDNGTQIEMTFERPLALDAETVAAAVRQTKPAKIVKPKSAIQCREIPATSGTDASPDTVIPGTPATPPTVIPGGPGMPDTVIPGNPGTSPIVIPGAPGTPGSPGGTWCPPPPQLDGPAAHKESFTLSGPVQFAGQQLAAGTYEATWEGLGPVAEVKILRKSKVVVTVQARVVALEKKAPDTEYAPRRNADGSESLDSVQFAGRTFGLRFDQ